MAGQLACHERAELPAGAYWREELTHLMQIETKAEWKGQRLDCLARGSKVQHRPDTKRAMTGLPSGTYFHEG